MDGKVRKHGWQCENVFVNGKVRVWNGKVRIHGWQSENKWMAM